MGVIWLLGKLCRDVREREKSRSFPFGFAQGQDDNFILENCLKKNAALAEALVFDEDAAVHDGGDACGFGGGGGLRVADA